MSRRQSPVTAVRDDASSSMSALLWPARSVGSGGALLACALRRADRAGQELLLRTGGAADLDAHRAPASRGCWRSAAPAKRGRTSSKNATTTPWNA
ncbi:hypothetical protein ACGF5T_35125 [Streptomyces sp. NPDC047853]|uniref:hypothetical protein n=1 Tax=unclassified Streptomyces TaxID=2593676 RepID=UPI003455EC8F